MEEVISKKDLAAYDLLDDVIERGKYSDIASLQEALETLLKKELSIEEVVLELDAPDSKGDETALYVYANDSNDEINSIVVIKDFFRDLDKAITRSSVYLSSNYVKLIDKYGFNLSPFQCYVIVLCEKDLFDSGDFIYELAYVDSKTKVTMYENFGIGLNIFFVNKEVAYKLKEGENNGKDN